MKYLLELLSEVDREFMQETSLHTAPTRKQSLQGYFPHSFKMDIKDEGDKYIVKADTPNFSQEDKKYININIFKDVLIIEYNKEEKEQKTSETEKYLLKERSEVFYAKRTIKIPNMTNDLSKVVAKLTDGVLFVEIPKAEEIKPAKISIE